MTHLPDDKAVRRYHATVYLNGPDSISVQHTVVLAADHDAMVAVKDADIARWSDMYHAKWERVHLTDAVLEQVVKERDAALANVARLRAELDSLKRTREQEADYANTCYENQKLREQDEVHWKTRRTLLADRDAARAEAEALRKALTASTDTKAAYMGEFSMTVPWPTIKEIMARILAYAQSKEQGT